MAMVIPWLIPLRCHGIVGLQCCNVSWAPGERASEGWDKDWDKDCRAGKVEQKRSHKVKWKYIQSPVRIWNILGFANFETHLPSLPPWKALTSWMPLDYQVMLQISRLPPLTRHVSGTKVTAQGVCGSLDGPAPEIPLGCVASQGLPHHRLPVDSRGV